MTFRSVRVALPLVALAAILAATLYPTGYESPEGWVRCIFCGERGTSDVLVNLILFTPLGIGLALRGWSLRAILLAGAALSGAIECAQLVIPGRDPSIGDLLSNATGAWSGGALARSARVWLTPPPATIGRWALGAVAVMLSALWGGSWLLGPQLPRSDYYGQWTPYLGHLYWYRGRVLAAALGGLPLPPHRLADAADVRQRLLDGAPLTARMVAGPQTPRLAPVVSIFDDRQREIMILGVDRTDLVWRLRTRAVRFGLDQPDSRAPGAVTTVRRGDTLTVTLRRHGRGLCLSVDGRERCGIGPRAGRAWALFMYPEGLPATARGFLDWAWIAGLCLPVGLFAAGSSSMVRLVSITAAVAGIALVPPLLGLLPSGPLEWTGAALGLTAGLAGRRVAGRWRSHG